jgi:UDP-glucose 4-epimerase
VWHRLYGVQTVGLRYFNVFGHGRTDLGYAVVIPRFIMWGLQKRPLEIHGDGHQSRDFTYIDNVVEANCLAAQAPEASGQAFNVGCGARVSLLQIVERLEQLLGYELTRRHAPTRAGDVPHTLADIDRAKRVLGYSPLVEFDEGLRRTLDYFRRTV